MQEVALAAGLFTLVVMVLGVLILFARAMLVPSGPVTINVNGERDFRVSAGDKLLGALTEVGLYLPSACGGGGTCGQCKVQVLEGGGDLLPTERSHINRKAAAEGMRLACQLTVQGDMKIVVPEDVFGVSRWTCTVRESTSVATFIREIVLALPPGEHIRFKAGGYVQVECPPHRMAYRDIDVPPAFRDDWQRYNLFALESNVTGSTTRAYSMANYPAEDEVIMLNVRIAPPPPAAPPGTPPGVMSSYLFSRKPGDAVQVSGPYGHFFARQSDAEMIFVGGGAGMAPMRSHILDQLKRIRTGRRISFWYGARSRREAFYVDLFDGLAAEHDNFSWHLALSEPLPEDHWTGPTGFVHDVLYRAYLRDHPAPEDCEYYLCGPPVMNAAVIAMLESEGVPRDNILLDDFGA
ncbi:MAG: NADH:ubiquinone reductase (Na(+)-transporting) subunit F [Pseudomonadales bacterium]